MDAYKEAGLGSGSGLAAHPGDRHSHRRWREIRFEVASGERALPLTLVLDGGLECAIRRVFTGG
jgi:hypothetical protein